METLGKNTLENAKKYMGNQAFIQAVDLIILDENIPKIHRQRGKNQ